MKRYHDKPKAPRVAEPVQVYLRDDELGRLARLVERLGTTKSDVLRQGLQALELQLTAPEAHPALAVIGIARDAKGPARPDPAREHDQILADDEVDAWSE
jgi:hypothetical protein